MPSNPYEKLNVYGKNQMVQAQDPSDSREIDARALLSCASKLKAVQELMEVDPKSKENLKLYAEAVRNNQRLWTIFQVAVVDPDNPLPTSLKSTLLSLSRYVDRTSFRAVTKYSPNLIDSLININRTIAAGLSRNPSAETQSAPPPVSGSGSSSPVMTSV